MEVERLWEQELEGCYVASHIVEEGREKIVFSSETEGTGKIIAVDPDSFARTVLSEGPGGCMGVVPVPGRDGNFLAIQQFFPVFQSENAQIVWMKKEGGEWRKRVVEVLPFAHRIDIVEVAGEPWLIAASLCRRKAFTDDWSTPGSVYAGRLNLDKEYIEDFHPILDGVFQNHGFCKIPGRRTDAFLVAGRCGVLRINAQPESEDAGGNEARDRPDKCGCRWGRERWRTELLLDFPCSDAVTADIDGDGIPEIGVIAPFHGEAFSIYKDRGSGYGEVFRLEGNHEFGHAVYGGKLDGGQSFLIGFRGGEKELYLITFEDGHFQARLVDKGLGPANVTVVAGKERDLICAANRESNRCTVYGLRR